MARVAPFVAVAGVLFAMAPFGIDMYLPALPDIARSLATNIDDVEASVAVFLLGYAFSQLLLGPLSDQYGRIKVILAGTALYIVGSVVCAISTSIEMLYAARLVQAFGGGASVTVFALVKDRFDERMGTQIISYIMAVTVIAPLIAPLAGALVLQASGWRAIFLVLAAWGVLALVMVGWNWKSQRQQEERAGALGSAFAAYGRILTNRTALLYCLTGALAFAGFFAFIAGSPFAYIEYFGVSPQQYGLLVVLNAAMMMAANLVNARLLADVSPERRVSWGVCVVGIAALLCVLAAMTGAGLWIVVAVSVLYVGGLGLTAANATSSALKQFADQDAGAGSAINGVFMFGLGAASSAIVGVLASTDTKPMLFTMGVCGLLAVVVNALPFERSTR